MLEYHCDGTGWTTLWDPYKAIDIGSCRLVDVLLYMQFGKYYSPVDGPSFVPPLHSPYTHIHTHDHTGTHAHMHTQEEALPGAN